MCDYQVYLVQMMSAEQSAYSFLFGCPLLGSPHARKKAQDTIV